MMHSQHKGLEAAGALAALSPQTQARMIEWDAAEVPEALWTASAFRQIGRAIASKRSPIAEKDLKRLFAEIERLLKSPDDEISNAVATGLLEEVWRAALQSDFDFSSVDPHLGQGARDHLCRWDDFNKIKTLGLKRR